MQYYHLINEKYFPIKMMLFFTYFKLIFGDYTCDFYRYTGNRQ